MRRQSIWQLIREEMGSSTRSRGKQRGTRNHSNGFWQGVADTIFLQPHKDDMLPVWKEVYRSRRLIREIERGTYQPDSKLDTWLGRHKRALIGAWYGFVDETKALLTALGFHLLTLTLILIFNLIWFGGLFWLIGMWLQ